MSRKHEVRGLSWNAVLGASIPPVLVAYLLTAIGALRIFHGWPLGPLHAGHVVVLALLVWAGVRAARAAKTRPAPPGRRVAAGGLAGLICGILVALAGIFLQAVDVRQLLVRVAPETGNILTLNWQGSAALLVLAAHGLALGAAGAAVVGAVEAPARRRAAPPSARRAGAQPPSERVIQVLAALIIGALVVAAPQLGPYWNHVLGSIGLFILLGLGLNIVVGYAGLLDLGYVAFFAIGAYGYAFLSGASRSVADLPFPVVIPLVMLLAALGGVLLGIPVLRLRGDYLAIVTLGFGEIIRLLVNNLTHLTGGPQGILQIPRPRLLGFEFHDPAHFFYLILIGCVIVAFVSARLNDSRIGRAWIAIREDEDVARALGINVWQHKLLAFGIGASFAGLGGAIFASRQSAIFPVDFTLLVSIYVLCLVIIGGMGSIPGVVLGSAILVGLPEVLRELADYRLLAFGALLVLTMAVRPEGLLPSWRRASEIHEQAGEDAVETTFEPAGMAGEPRR